jgi:hypothetical protein
MENENEFVTHEQALSLKELGFDEPCLAKHDLKYILLRIEECKSQENAQEFDYILAPLYQQAFRWFREKHDKLCSIEFVEPEYRGKYGYKLYYKLGHQYIDHWSKGFKTYEDVQNACLNELIELVKQK